MSYSFWRPPALRPGALAPSDPLATPLFSGLSHTLLHVASTFDVATSNVDRWASSVFLKTAEPWY